MEGLTVRGYRPGDADMLVDLWNEVARHVGGHPGLTTEGVESFLSTAVRDPALDTRLVFAPDGTLAAAGAVVAPPAGGVWCGLDGGVHPRWRGQGIGRDLLAWQLARAAQLHRTTAPETGWQAHAATWADDKDAVRLLRRFGMEPVRYWFDMAAPTAAPPAMPVPEGVRVEPYQPRHETRLHAAHMEAFAGHWGFQYRPREEWAAMSVRSDAFLPELSLLAFDGGQLAGYLLSYTDADPTRLYLGQVGVRPEWRRRGLASALLVRALATAATAGKSSAALGVDADSPTGAVSVYQRTGFVVENRAITYATAIAAPTATVRNATGARSRGRGRP